MAFYLQLDGVDDKIVTPTTVTVNKVELDVLIPTPPNDGSIRFLSDASNRTSGGFIRYGGTALATNMTVTGAAFDTRTTIIGTIGTAFTGGRSFGIGFTGAQPLRVDVHSIKLYNGTTLIAHYDMSTQTVQDQSGNGNHATLTGGTWVDDGLGGGGSTNVTVTSVIATATSSAIAPTVTAQQNASITSVIASSIADGIAPTVSAQKQVTITSVVANSTATALAPSVGISSLISSVVASAAAAGIVPTVNAIRNIEIIGSIASALASAGVPRIHNAGWNPIAAASTTWRPIADTSTTWRESTETPTIWR